ncbi:hypothetical protein MN032_17455 [Agromyces atrinae]|uniref:hypothetical protein n=1 Tax=Agromyces atrinae TaxID=592376 RepID=UPI001F5A028E|nr:hypothetical protein [Agromyces atrinae]MCI2959474.1 hypothetical protein [Agromyces atrinae]
MREKQKRGRTRTLLDSSTEDKARALKERVYASFTGLAIVTVLALNAEHQSAVDAVVSLAAGIVGITLAGFVAEVIAFQVSHRTLPPRSEFLTMLRIAGGAIGSASLPFLALVSAWIGWISIETALTMSVGIYFVTLIGIALVAVLRTKLPPRQQLIALGAIIGLSALVVIVLIAAHGH